MISVLVLLVFGSTSFAETTVSTRRDGKQVIAEAVQALGGERFLAMQDRVATGWTTSWQREASRLLRTKFYDAYPSNSAVTKHTYDKQETHALLINDSGAYEITFRGSRPLEKDRADRLVLDERLNVLNLLRTRALDPTLTFDYRGPTVCELQSGELVDIVSEDPETPILSVCFNQTTKLPIRQSYFRRDPLTKDRIEEVAVFSRYLDAGNGVTWPRHIAHVRDGDPVRDFFYETVTINSGLKPELFSTPGAAVPALTKATQKSR